MNGDLKSEIEKDNLFVETTSTFKILEEKINNL